MAAIIDINGPNREWGKHHVEVMLQLWYYRKTIVFNVGGNTIGLSVIRHAIDQLVDRIAEAGCVELVNEDGDTLTDDGSDEPWSERRVHDMIVSARIISYTPPTLNAIRARNGAGPLPERDRPHDHDADSVVRRRAERTISAA